MGMPLEWHRRQAIVLASQLPDDKQDVLLVLEALTRLIDSFIVQDAPASCGANVVPFSGAR
jgi:hypothetical protein